MGLGSRKGLLALLFVGSAVYAQSNLATVTGIVTDTAQAVIPGVTVTIRNVETNISRRVETNDVGDFTITNLPPGSFELTAEIAGFRTYRETGLVLEVGQELRNDIRLQVGSVTEQVSVTAEITTLNTEKGTIKGEVMVHEQIRDLPLDGRDFTDLAFFVSGVVPRAQGGQGSAMNINGARADSTNFYVDGFSNRNPRGAAAQARPNIDALEEFKMEVSGFSAEYGRMAGGILNMVLRSGTNNLHGTLFEFLRNDILDARAYFDTERLKLRRNQFGGLLSGPIRRDRTFFLFSWESYRQVLGESRLGRVPIAAERAGNFLQSFNSQGQPVTLSDPLGGKFPDNRIPPSRFHPIAPKLLSYYPLPNRPDPKNNYITSANDPDVWDSFLGKLDHRFDEKNSMAFRYQKRFNRTTDPFAGSDLGTFGNKVRDDRSLLGLDFTHMFSPALLVELRTGYSRNAERDVTIWAGQNVAAELGIPGTTANPELLGFPRFLVLDHLTLGSADNQPVQFFVTDIQWNAKFTWVRAKHVLKWGFDLSRVRFNQPYFNNNRGTMRFLDRWTGHPIGDLLLGLLNNSSRTVGFTRNYMRSTSYGLFFNDDYKVARALTLNLGLRYEVDLPPVDRYDRMSNFVPGLNKIVISSDRTIPNLPQLLDDAKLADRVVVAHDVGLPRSLVYPDYNNVAPRVGFAWRPRNSLRTVVRGGYGLFYTGHLLNPIRLSLMTGYPFSINQTFQRQASRPDGLTLFNPFPDERAQLDGVVNSNGYELHPATGYLQCYNLTVEREIGRGTVVELAYVGSKGTHLGRRYDINQPYRTLESYQAGRGFPRPISGLQTINFDAFGSNSIYSAGQISVRRRARGGLFYLVNYTYSKSIDDASQLNGNADGGFAGAQDSRNLKSERGRSDWDRGHVFTAVFAVPVPLARRNRIAGGWQLSGTATLYTGDPFTVQAADVDTSLGESTRPNRLGKGVQPDLPGAGRRGIDYPFFNLGDFEKVPRCNSPTDCQPSPRGFQPFGFGNAGRNILDGPGQAFLTFGLLKNFRIREGRNIHFRYEVFNVFNHPNFLLPNRQFNSLTGGTVTRVTESGRGGPRVMQVALKYEF